MAVCRECHKKMTFKLPEVKFLRVSSAERPNRPLPRKKPKENLGIAAGTELPRKGRCQHYAKSYRWFRFSCCQKVYACDRCHDAAEEHPNEHANRMICGLCSREQHYRPEDCGFCHSGLIGKKSGGFWGGYPKEHIPTPFHYEAMSLLAAVLFPHSVPRIDTRPSNGYGRESALFFPCFHAICVLS
jgi:uncharacterized CHY-type Zn-finger protein